MRESVSIVLMRLWIWLVLPGMKHLGNLEIVVCLSCLIVVFYDILVLPLIPSELRC